MNHEFLNISCVKVNTFTISSFYIYIYIFFFLPKDKSISSSYHSNIARKSLSSRKLPGFPGSSVVKYPPADSRDKGSIPDLGGSHIPQSN